MLKVGMLKTPRHPLLVRGSSRRWLSASLIYNNMLSNEEDSTVRGCVLHRCKESLDCSECKQVKWHDWPLPLLRTHSVHIATCRIGLCTTYASGEEGREEQSPGTCTCNPSSSCICTLKKGSIVSQWSGLSAPEHRGLLFGLAGEWAGLDKPIMLIHGCPPEPPLPPNDSYHGSLQASTTFCRLQAFAESDSSYRAAGNGTGHLTPPLITSCWCLHHRPRPPLTVVHIYVRRVIPPLHADLHHTV